METNFPAVMDPQDLSAALQNSQVQETAIGGVSFLKMDFESGEWSLGQDNEDVGDEEIIVLTDSIQHGWILWSGGRPKKVMTSFVNPLPNQPESIGDDHPSEGRSFQAAMADNGDMVAFDTNSYGGRKGADQLLGAIKAHAAEGSKHLYPRVKLGSESYANAKRGGKLTYNPVFEIVAWCDAEGNAEGAKAKKVEDKTAKAEAEPEEKAEEQPKRQRRQRRKAS